MIGTIFILAASALIGAVAQRPSNVSICDFYSGRLLGDVNATTQNTLLTLLVNTAIIGNYTTPNKLAVPGILAENAVYNGTPVNLLPYFDGKLKSTNTGQKTGVSVNFLDDGGAEPLKMNKPANGTTSHQYKLLTHLYSYFGLLLGCSKLGKPGFPAYTGDASMYHVHRYMSLDAYQVQYFIEQVSLSAASFGVSVADIEWVGHALQQYFGYRCEMPAQIIPGKPFEHQSICTADDCPLAPNATCKQYASVTNPKSSAEPTPKANATSSSATPSSSKKSSANCFSVSLVTIVLVIGAVLFVFG